MMENKFFTNEDGEIKDYKKFMEEIGNDCSYVIYKNEKVHQLSQELWNVLIYYKKPDNSELELYQKICDKLAFYTVIDLLDFIKKFGLLNVYNPKESIINSFDYESGLKNLIEEFEKLISYDLNSPKPDDFDEYPDSYTSQIRYREGYEAGITSKSLFFHPIITDTIKYRYFNFYVYEMVHGALIAYHLPKLKDELKVLNDNKIQLPEKKEISNIQKINWNGTPGEFGAIFDLLIDNGYIQQIKDKKTTAKFLQRFFDVRNKNGEEVDERYFYKCFGEKKKQYFPHELKIIPSDNLGKDK